MYYIYMEACFKDKLPLCLISMTESHITVSFSLAKLFYIISCITSSYKVSPPYDSILERSLCYYFNSSCLHLQVM